MAVPDLATGELIDESFFDYVTPTAWVAATLQNSWVQYDAVNHMSAAYRKVGDEVQLRGLVKNGVVAEGTPIFTLPAGFRPPSFTVRFAVGSNAAFGWLAVSSGGVVGLGGGSNGWVDLAPVRFSVTA